MKTIKSLLAAAGLLVASSSFAQSLPTIYAFWLPSSHNFETANYEEGARARGQYLGIAWKSVGQQPGAIPLYRCVVPGRDGQHHFTSPDSNCEGQRTEGMYGYVFSTQVNGTVPLLRYYAHVNAQGQSDHVATTVPMRQDGYYWLEGVLGYVYPVTEH